MNNHFGICFSQAKTPLAESVSLGKINSHTHTHTHTQHTLLFCVYNIVTSELDNSIANVKHLSFLSFPALINSLQQCWCHGDFK